jgi:hypothetical protein
VVSNPSTDKRRDKGCQGKCEVTGERIRDKIAVDNVRLVTAQGLWQCRGHEHDAQPLPGLPLSGCIINHAVWLYHCFRLACEKSS